MKLVIAGSRSIYLLPRAIMELVKQFDIRSIEQVVSGKAEGMDTAGEEFALEYVGPAEQSIKPFPPEKEKYPERCYKIRNRKMAAYGDALLLVWDGSSSGSAHMKGAMLELGKPVYEVILKTHNVEKT